MKSAPRFAAALLLLVSGAVAQVSATVGPQQAPLGCPVAITLANDTPSAVYTGPCPYYVTTPTNVPVYTPFCIAIIVSINPGAVFTVHWPQINDNGLQVPPGAYLVHVTLPGGANTTVTVTVTGVPGAAIAGLGPNRVGTTRNFEFCSPQDGGYAYLGAASFPPAAGAILTCAGLVPLEFDSLFQLSTSPNPFFLNFSGVLPANGTTAAPALLVPNLPALSGSLFVIDFVVLDFAAPCPVRRIAQGWSVFIL